MATYNGHKNWNHWNVSLWINNDQSLYELAQLCLKDANPGKGFKDRATYLFLNDIKEEGVTQTPDGAPYSFTTVRAALAGIDK